MMYENRCPGCMEILPAGSTVCPACGYSSAQARPEGDILPEGSILAARYMVGRALRRTAFELRYMGYDCLEQRKFT